MSGFPQDRIQCPCGHVATRRYSFSVGAPMGEHFNFSVGRYVSNSHQLKDELKRKSEEASIRTGFDSNFELVDPADTKSLGVTDEGLYETAKVKHDGGIITP